VHPVPRALVAFGLVGGYSLTAWLRFDRTAYATSVTALVVSLAIMGYGMWVQARLMQRERRASTRAARQRGKFAGDAPSTEELGALKEWNEAQQAASLADTVQKGPVANAISIFPAIYFWVATPLFLFLPASALHRGSGSVPPFVLALLLAVSTALAFALVSGFAGWWRARDRARGRSNGSW
jgi:nicotinamide riboside transporter PnuC